MQKMHDRKNIGKLVLDPAAEPKPKPATPAKIKVKKEKKEKVTSPTTDEEKKVENGDDKPAENGAGENGEAAEAEKPKENGDGDAKPAENGESAETNGDGKQKPKGSTLTRLTRMLSK